MDLDLRKVQWMLKVSRQPLSLEHPVGDDDDSELGHFIENENSPTPDEDTQERMLNTTLEHLLKTLEPARGAYPAHALRPAQRPLLHAWEEVGRKFGLTRERIRQIEGRALTRLRHPPPQPPPTGIPLNATIIGRLTRWAGSGIFAASRNRVTMQAVAFVCASRSARPKARCRAAPALPPTR